MTSATSLRQAGRRLLLILLLVLLVGLVACAVVTAWQARLALGDLDRLQTLAAAPSAEALPAVRDDVARLESHLTTIRAAGAPFLLLSRGLGWLPRYGPTLGAAASLLDMGIELTAGGRIALDALAPLTGRLGRGGDLLAEAGPALTQAAPQLAAAEARLARAQTLRQSLPADLHPKLAAQLPRLDALLPLARAGLQIAGAAPALLGTQHPTTYLLLAQNNHELRGTGGFISAAGIVRLEAGRIAELKLTDAYAVDDLAQPHPAPPAALAEQMGVQILMLRDSNWSPDFTEASQVARALYEQDRGIATDGAIAFDLEAVRLLVSALGPLQLPGVAEPVSGDNVITWMERAWAAPRTTEGTVAEAAASDWWARRKDFMGDLMTAALAKLQGGGDLNLMALARAAQQMLAGRHVQIAADDPALAVALAAQGWDGGLRPPAGADFLGVIDSNVGFNKANAAVTQQIAYRVEPAEDGPVATLTLTYTHTAPAGSEPVCDRAARYGDSYEALVNRCFWDYLRVYAPGDSVLLAAEGLNRAATEPGEAGTTIFTGSFVLRPGDTTVITLRYRLPAALATGPYRLLVRKQAGTLAPPLTVEAGTCRWTTDLAEDRSFACDAV